MIAGPFAGNIGIDINGAAEFLSAIGQGERVQSLPVLAERSACWLFAPRQYVERASGCINCGSGSDSNFRLDKGALSIVRRNGRGAFRQEALAPKRSGWPAVSIEGVYAVVLGRDEQHIVPALVWNFDAFHQERLSVDVS